MTDGSPSGDDDGLWAYVPPSEARVPQPPVEEKFFTGLSAVRETLARLRDLGGGDESSATVERGEEGGAVAEAEPLPDTLRDRMAPVPDWTGAVAALDDVLGPGLEEGPALVHEAGYDDAPSIVAAWGARHGATVLEPPARDRLVEEEGAAWAAAQRTEGTPWVLPCLEHWWVRTPDGLDFVRSLLDAWAEGTLGSGVIGVDQHAWRYLSQAWPGQVLCRVAPRPLSGEGLGHWFSKLARQGGGPDGTVEEWGGGGRVLSVPDRDSAQTADPAEEIDHSSFLRSLAAYSDGDPGVAWSLWRHSLLAPGPEASASSVAAVRSWTDVDRPGRPDDLERTDLLLLHALVLHGGLTDAVLAHVTPIDQYERRGRLRSLAREGLLTRADGMWRVPPLGYPVVCALLRDEAYLPDWRSDG